MCARQLTLPPRTRRPLTALTPFEHSLFIRRLCLQEVNANKYAVDVDSAFGAVLSRPCGYEKGRAADRRWRADILPHLAL